jgi:hypothetical protein
MEGDDAMKEEEHPVLHDVPIGIDATGQRHETECRPTATGARKPSAVLCISRATIACRSAGRSTTGKREA